MNQGELSDPADHRLLAGDERRRRFRMANYDWRHRHAGKRKTEQILVGLRVEVALRESDPAAAKALGVGGEHDFPQPTRSLPRPMVLAQPQK